MGFTQRLHRVEQADITTLAVDAIVNAANSALSGAFICALVITWYVVGGTATHWSPEFKLPPRPAAAAK